MKAVKHPTGKRSQSLPQPAHNAGHTQRLDLFSQRVIAVGNDTRMVAVSKTPVAVAVTEPGSAAAAWADVALARATAPAVILPACFRMERAILRIQNLSLILPGSHACAGSSPVRLGKILPQKTA